MPTLIAKFLQYVNKSSFSAGVLAVALDEDGDDAAGLLPFPVLLPAEDAAADALDSVFACRFIFGITVLKEEQEGSRSDNRCRRNNGYYRNQHAFPFFRSDGCFLKCPCAIIAFQKLVCGNVKYLCQSNNIINRFPKDLCFAWKRRAFRQAHPAIDYFLFGNF